MAISRRALDAALIQEAVAAGARFCSEARVRLGPLLPDRRILQVPTGDGVQEVSARVVIAADGLGSGLMSQAGEPSLTRPITRRRMVGLGAVFDLNGPGFEAGVIHMAVGEVGYLGAVRDEDGNLNVAAAVDSGALRRGGSPGRLAHALLLEAGWPVDETFVTGDWKGTPELTRSPVRPGAERLFAVGDASGYVEPFTGEGVLWALSGARALAPIAAETRDIWDPGLLDRWSRVHASMIGRAQRVCRAITWTLARPGLSRALLRTFSASPRLAAPVVNRVGSPLFRSA
jgi:flavin-dependent dehydrogenase